MTKTEKVKTLEFLDKTKDKAMKAVRQKEPYSAVLGIVLQDLETLREIVEKEKFFA